MTTSSKAILKFGLGFLVAIVFLALAFRNTNLDEVLESLRGVNYWWLLLMFLCLILSHAMRSLRWRYLLEPIKMNIGLRNLFSGVMIGYMMNNVLPRAGEIARPYAIGKLESIPKSSALGTIVVERLMDMMCFLVLILLIPLVYDGPLLNTFPWIEQAGLITAIVSIGLFVAMMFLMFRRDWTSALVGGLAKVLPGRFATKVEILAHSFLDGFLFLKRPGNFAIILILTVVVWGLYLLMTFVSFFAFGFQTQLGLGSALVVLAISSIGVAIPTPGATGTYHFFTSETLVRLFLIDADAALSFATATHAVGFIGVTIIGTYFFFHDHMRMKEVVESKAQA